MANRAILTFTSEGTDGDQVRISFNNGSGIVQTVVTWRNTPTAFAEVEIVPTVGTVGAEAAIRFVAAFDALYNSAGLFNLSRVDNVVTVDLTDPTHSYQVVEIDLGTEDTENQPTPFTVDANIDGQELTNVFTYCYLYEPLVATIQDTNQLTTKFFIDLAIIDTETGLGVETLIKYGEFDINPGIPLKVDLMEMARQYHNAKIYELGRAEDIEDAWHMVVSRYKYNFQIYSNTITQPLHVNKLPLIGGRDFLDFTPVVDVSTPTSGDVLEDISLVDRWDGYYAIDVTLADPTALNSRPTITVDPQTVGCTPEGFLIWKSNRAGWMTWGFEIMTEARKKKHEGKLDTEIWESDADVNGHRFKPVNYTGVKTTRSVNLKSLALTKAELRAVSEIAYSPAVYFVDENGVMELVKVSSHKTPLDSLSNGGDFSVAFDSIGSVNQSTL